jgi:2-methylisocitrate lyase-like PEP mutase family enzyme
VSSAAERVAVAADAAHRLPEPLAEPRTTSAASKTSTARAVDRELADAAMRRISGGGALARAAYGALAAAAQELLTEGTATYAAGGVSNEALAAALAARA